MLLGSPQQVKDQLRLLDSGRAAAWPSQLPRFLDPRLTSDQYGRMFEKVTSNVLVQVSPVYVKEQSSPEQGHYFFAYNVVIHNQSDKALQLLRRHWIITDGEGRVEEIEGEGVVGQQPRLEPGERFQYTSFCPLQTPTGNMQGSYFLEDGDKKIVEVKIPMFLLCEPSHFH